MLVCAREAKPALGELVTQLGCRRWTALRIITNLPPHRRPAAGVQTGGWVWNWVKTSEVVDRNHGPTYHPTYRERPPFGRDLSQDIL